MEPQQAKSNLVPTVIAGIVIASIVGGGVYAYEKSQNDTKQADLQSQIDSLKMQIATKPSTTPPPVATASPLTSATPTPATADLTANWKVYTLDEARISFRYPADWGAVTVLHGRTSQGTSPYIQFSTNKNITAGTYSKDMSAGRGGLDHEFAIQTIISTGNDCQKITLNPADKLSCTAISTKSGTTAYYVGNLGDHTPGPGPQELLTGYAQYPSTYNFPDFVFLSTGTGQQSADLVKQLLSTVKFL